jgi:ABC-type cobalamin/Fe3+-siderophores transport system ATPase subunit
MYVELINELNRLRERTARFRRVALHLHSPDSKDWGAREAADPSRNDRARFRANGGLKEFANELRAHLDLVAVTDHMRCDFASRLSQSVGCDEEFVVLPGMEVNLRLEPPLDFLRIHLLAILPEGSTSEAFSRLFFGQNHIPDDAERTGQEEVTGLTLSQWVQRVHDEQGICIAAHIDNKQGIRCLFRQTAQQTLRLFCRGEGVELERENDVPESLKNYLLTANLDAIEIQKAIDAAHYRWICTVDGQTKWVATTLKFDAHCVEEFKRPHCTTHIKMTSLGLRDLSEALKFPDTRIRFPENLPDPPLPRVLGIQIKGGDGAFFKDVTIATAENLSCIIGVRGSGKSTIVEALRYAFGYNRTLNELDKQLASSVSAMQKANLVGCIIRVAYRMKSGEDRILTATFDEKAPYATKVYTPTGDFVDVADVEACGDFKLRLFGWSEIENLGRVPARQRDLLDRLIEEVQPILRKRAELRQELTTNRASVQACIANVRKAFEKNDGEIRRYKEFKADFDKLNTTEVKGLFAALDLAQEKRRVLVKLQANAESQIKKLEPGAVTLREDLSDILQRGSAALRNWWLEEEIAKLAVVAAESDVQGALQSAVGRRRSFVEIVVEHIKQIDAAADAVQKELQAKFAADDTMQMIADLRANAEERLRRVTDLRDAYTREWTKLLEALGEREKIADRLVSIQNEIAGIRAKHNASNEQRLNRFLPEWMKVSVDFKPSRDTGDFANKLQSLFGARGNQVKKVKQFVEGACTPVAFASMLRFGDLSSLEGKTISADQTCLDFTADDTQMVIDKTRPFEKSDPAEVDIMVEDGKRLQLILELQETPWDDFEAILLNGSPVNQRSPGQRSSAMLPLIALAESSPLVIDPPEDNLDKRLIGSVLMKVLADLKEKRQIIVCTHDPNILVGGDAEQVIVLEAESDRRGKVGSHGSIDNKDIIALVIDLLEGGAEAFETRKKRYALT